MKPIKSLLILFFLIIAQLIYCQQERIVTGVLKDKEGNAIPGVSIAVKGTTIGTVTDAYGFYSMKVTLGVTLVYTFIGFEPTEMVVTVKNSKPVNTTFIRPTKKSVKVQTSYTPITESTIIADSIENEVGTAQFTSSTPTYQFKDPSQNQWNKIDPSKIVLIKVKDNKALVTTKEDKYFHIPHITFTSTITIDKPNKLPELQNQFVQGQPEGGIAIWRGPETGEIFSWGPKIDNLEFDGSTYNFDKNGRLVPKGMGNGQRAQAYNPYTFFGSGTSFFNSLKINSKTEKKDYVLSYSNSVVNGLIRNSKKTCNSINFNGSLRLKKWIKFGYHLFFEGYNSNLMSDNPNLSVLMASVITTPPSFDNANGYSGKQAMSNPTAFELNNLDQRSSSPGNNNNPYWLANHLPDLEKFSCFNNSIETEIVPYKDFKINIQTGFEDQTVKNTFGYPPLTASINDPLTTDRSDKLRSLNSSLGVSYYFRNGSFTMDNSITYEYRSSNRSLTRTDFHYNDNQLNNLNSYPSLNDNKLFTVSNFNFNEILLLKIANNFNSSNLIENNKLMYNPNFGVAAKIHDLLDWYDAINFLKIRYNWGYAHGGSPLFTSLGNYYCQPAKSEQFQQAYFETEILPNLSLQSEKVMKSSLGMDIDFLRDKITSSFEYYWNSTNNAILPINENNSVLLKNLADTKTKGFDADISIIPNRYRNTYYWFKVTFSHKRVIVTDLKEGLEEIPLGGFSDIHTALLKDKPYGSIVGTAYQRTTDGQLVIGNDGYPLVDSKLRVIGNPNPDYLIGLESFIKYKQFHFDCLFEFKKGGQVWNGTENALSFLGLSQKTVEGRKVLEYIYPGVREDGAPNNILVDFVNPAKPIEANRWFKYGPTGVAEDAIQDASWFRIKELKIGYSVENRRRLISEISFFIRNPILITKYSGVDPQTTLWGQQSTYGLDLFNLPNLTSFGIFLKVTL